MMRALACCLLLSLTACATRESAFLRWKVDPGVPHEYSTLFKDIFPFDSQGLVLAHGAEVLADPQLRENVKKGLASFSFPPANAKTSIKLKNDHLRVVITAITPEYTISPKDEQEESLREIERARSGELLLVGDMDYIGNLLSFYLRTNQNDLMSFFYLPKESVREGDFWSVPIDLVEISTNYFPDKLSRVNQVFLDEYATLENGDSIAKLFYVVSETVVGEYRFSYSEEVVASEIKMSFLAYAEFNVDQGRWHKFTGVTYFTSEGYPGGEALTIYALKPKEPLIDKADPSFG